MHYDEILKNRGYRKIHAGTRMLAYAANIAEQLYPVVSLTKDVYPAVEEDFGVSCAERTMRYAARAAGDSRTVGEIIWDLVDEGEPG